MLEALHLNPFKVLMAVGWLMGWVLLYRVPRLSGSSTLAQDDDPITVVIPARNEASSLPNLLGDLARERPAGARILVVDDQSEDTTGEIARSFDFVEVIDASALRDGWIGKTWACHTGSERAQAGTLVFLDADVRLHGDALARAVAMQRRCCDLLTIWPRHMVKKPYEYMSAIFNTVTMMAVAAGSLIRPRRPSGGFGPMMITSSEAYEAAGGHAAVRDQVIDDFALAGCYARAGKRIVNLGGGKDVTFRMYPDGFESLIDGWTKNMGSGCFTLSFLRLAALVFWVTMGLGALTWGGGIPRTFPTILYALFVVQMFVMFRQLGNFGVISAVLYPLQIILLCVILLRSWYRTYVRRSVIWRGREVRISRFGGRTEDSPD